MKLDKAGIDSLEQLIAFVQNEDWYEQIPTSNPAWAQRVIVVLLSIGAIDEDCIGCKIKKNNSKSEPIQVRRHIYKCENCHIFFKSFRRIDRCRNCGYYLRGAWIYEDMVEYYRRCEKEMLREDKCEVVAGDDAAVSPHTAECIYCVSDEGVPHSCKTMKTLGFAKNTQVST